MKFKQKTLWTPQNEDSIRALTTCEMAEFLIWWQAKTLEQGHVNSEKEVIAWLEEPLQAVGTLFVNEKEVSPEESEVLSHGRETVSNFV